MTINRSILYLLQETIYSKKPMDVGYRMPYTHLNLLKYVELFPFVNKNFLVSEGPAIHRVPSNALFSDTKQMNRMTAGTD
jgi:hypothetical protein